MASIFEPVYTFLGLAPDFFEIVLSTFVVVLIFIVILFMIVQKRKSGAINSLKARNRELEREFKEDKKHFGNIEQEKARLLQQHEEALARLKEAKDVILKRETDFKSQTGKLQDDVSKVAAMEEELKTYRIKLGELNKEKERLMAGYETDKESTQKNQGELKKNLEKELAKKEKEFESIKGDFEDDLKDKETAHERRVEAIKEQTKEAIVKITKEKDIEMEDSKSKNAKLLRQIEKLKDEIRVLEIEKL